MKKENLEFLLKALIKSSDKSIKYLSEEVRDFELIEELKDVLDWDILLSRKDLSPREEFLERFKDCINWDRYYPKSIKEIYQFKDKVSNNNWIKIGRALSRYDDFYTSGKLDNDSYKIFRELGNEYPILWSNSLFDLGLDYDFLMEDRNNSISPYLITVKPGNKFTNEELFNGLLNLLNKHPEYLSSVFGSVCTLNYIEKLIFDGDENQVNLGLKYMKLYVDKTSEPKQRIWNNILFNFFDRKTDESRLRYYELLIDSELFDIPWENTFNIIPLNLLSKLKNSGRLHIHSSMDITKIISGFIREYSKEEERLVYDLLTECINYGKISDRDNFEYRINKYLLYFNKFYKKRLLKLLNKKYPKQDKDKRFSIFQRLFRWKKN